MVTQGASDAHPATIGGCLEGDLQGAEQSRTAGDGSRHEAQLADDAFEPLA